VKHEHEPGHGVRAYIYSSRHGQLGNWILHNQTADAKAENLAVESGDTIDFIVSINESLNNNEFLWSPVIRMVGANAIKDANGYAREWDARREFSGPPAQMGPTADALGEICAGALVGERVFVCGLKQN
jgi:hypothetical protein